MTEYLLEVTRVNRHIKNSDGYTAEELATEMGVPKLLACFKKPVTPRSPTRKQATLSETLSRKRPREELVAPQQASSAPQLAAPAELEAEGPEKKRPRIEDHTNIANLHFAALNGQLERVVSILNDGLPIDSIYPFSGQTALHASAQAGQVAMVRGLLSRGAKVDSCTFGAQIPLHLACEYTNPRASAEVVADLLLAMPNTVNHPDLHGRSPLYYVCGSFSANGVTQQDHPEKVAIAWLLIKNGANPALAIFDLETDIDAMTPLHKAIMRREYKIMKALLSHPNCPINAQNGLGRTPFHEAVRLADIVLIDRLLIDPRLDLRILDNQRLTALDMVNANIQESPDDGYGPLNIK